MMNDDALTNLITFVTTDFAGITRGRAMAAADWQPGKRKSLGWVPANMSLTPFDVIADPNPWGSVGDLRLLPDDGAHFCANLPGSVTPFDVVMADIVELDGTPWALCPRSLLKSALADLERKAGITLIASFEHEFQVFGADWPAAPAFSLQALRRADPFGPAVMGALQAAGLHPEVFIAEYGRDQFEMPIAPAPGLVAADRAVVLREIVRELARNRSWRASFAPKTAVEGVGNGVHIHLSFQDAQGNPVAYDATKPGNVSTIAGAFVAGIMRHLPALVAFTAPNPISYLRLTPHHWSSSYTWFGNCDREASLRICPVPTITGADPARAFNIEYRPADATACPHLALAVLLRAGLEGIRANLPTPPLFSGDPETLTAAEREKLGLYRLPQTLEVALAALLVDPVVLGWFDPLMIETYVGMKQMEMRLAGADLNDALCQRYAGIY
jgi:glutamine synthetase